MTAEEIVKQIADTLADWRARRVWGCVEIEIHDGEITLLRLETKTKFTTGGSEHGPARFERR